MGRQTLFLMKTDNNGLVVHYIIYIYSHWVLVSTPEPSCQWCGDSKFRALSVGWCRRLFLPIWLLPEWHCTAYLSSEQRLEWIAARVWTLVNNFALNVILYDFSELYLLYMLIYSHITLNYCCNLQVFVSPSVIQKMVLSLARPPLLVMWAHTHVPLATSLLALHFVLVNPMDNGMAQSRSVNVSTFNIV